MSIELPGSLNEQVSEEAAEWLVEFRTGDIDSNGRRRFDAWLRASPQHIQAFIEMAALWHEGGSIDPQRRLDVEEAVARARSERNIAALTPERGGGPTASRARIVWWAVAATLLLAVSAGALILGLGLRSPPTYITDAGARRSILLPDGSKVLLDSKSRLRVSYTAAARKVELLEGQAMFYVSRNPRRPFLVRAGHTVVRDVGTVFDVNRLGNGTVVTVVEGSVAVAMPSPIHLSAGEQLDVLVGQLAPQPIHVDISSEIAWTHGEVVLDAATLAEVAQVFNRYSTRTIVAQDLGKKPLRLSGVFSTNPDFVIGYLRGRPDIALTESDSEIDIVRNPSRDGVH
jgi:transmembrane sensor